MPRPPKHVSPDTLGGRIRAARENMHLSLAEVAADRYSTSLISQIERNKVDPSFESLQFLAEKLNLPIDELTTMVQQKRELETEDQQIKNFEHVRIQAVQLIANQQSKQALETLKNINVSLIPKALRWRIAALRGQCYFNLRQFLKALQDFLFAVTEKPDTTSEDQKIETMTLHLHLGSTLRELEQLDEAIEQYQYTLNMMDQTTQFGYVAEAHWGLALATYSQAMQIDCTDKREKEMKIALDHAQMASILSRSINANIRAATLACLIATIEHALGQEESAKKHFREVYDQWRVTIGEDAPDQEHRKERASIVSSAACSLASIELEQGHFDDAHTYVDEAWKAGEVSYILRRAQAKIMLGRLLSAQNPNDPAAVEAFQEAIKELEPTERIAALVQAYDYLGRHLLKKGDVVEGEKALDRARHLSRLASANSTDTVSAEDAPSSDN